MKTITTRTGWTLRVKDERGVDYRGPGQIGPSDDLPFWKAHEWADARKSERRLRENDPAADIKLLPAVITVQVGD